MFSCACREMHTVLGNIAVTKHSIQLKEELSLQTCFSKWRSWAVGQGGGALLKYGRSPEEAGAVPPSLHLGGFVSASTNRVT